MKNPCSSDITELEKEYRRITIERYKIFSKYILAGLMAIVIFETSRTLLAEDMTAFVSFLGVIGVTIFSLKWVWAQKDTYEIGITIFCLFFHASGFIIEYLNQKPFSAIYETFFFSYSYSMTERLMVEGMSNLKHRIFFSIFTIIMRITILLQVEFSTYVKHCWITSLTILVGIYREKHTKEGFFSYFNSREQLAKFKDLVVEHIPDAIVIVSQDLTKSYFVNNSFLNLVKDIKPDTQSQLRSFLLKEGLSSVQNTDASPLISSLRRNTLLDFINNTLIADGVSCIVFSCKKDCNGEKTRQLFEVKFSKIVWDGHPCIAIILHDITEHHTLLSLKIADAQKDKVLATVSHELKTPLNGMLGMIQVMEKKIKDSELLRFLDICKSSTSLLLSLVCSILDLNQLRADKMKLNLENIDVKKLVKEVISLFEYQCQQKRIYLRTRIAPDVPYFLYTDKNRLSQVLINLLGNAQKFTSKGGIIMDISRGGEENSVRFSVEDTGIGISQQDQSKLFQIFGKLSQEDEIINRHGVGLGLTIAESLVNALNHNRKQTKEINVESEPGQGSIFSFTITPARKINRYEEVEGIMPTIPDVPDEKTSPHERREPYCSPLREHIGKLLRTSPALRKTESSGIPLHFSHTRKGSSSFSPLPCILLVDDNLFNIAVAEHLVLSHGYRVKSALSGHDAIDIVKRNNYINNQIILILMDCQMPIMDGYETTRKLKKMMQSKEVPMIPIVALTANDSEKDREACKRAGMCDHLSKPLNDSLLERVLKKYC